MENWGGQVDPVNRVTQSGERQSVNCRTVSRFIWFIRHRFAHWPTIGSSLVSKRAFWFPTIHPRNHQQILRGCDPNAGQTTTNTYIHIIYRARYTKEWWSGFGTDGISLPFNRTASNGNTGSLIYSVPRKSFPDKMEAPCVIWTDQTVLFGWWKISEKLTTVHFVVSLLKPSDLFQVYTENSWCKNAHSRSTNDLLFLVFFFFFFFSICKWSLVF